MPFLRPPLCPECDEPMHRALSGVFPIWVCLEDRCLDEWGLITGGFWAPLAAWVDVNLNPCPPTDEDGSQGFAVMAYRGSYFIALWRLLRGHIKEEP